jgi:type IV secretion system protein VirD4
MRAMKNYAGHRLSPWLGHLMVSRQETARPLLTAGEVMQLPSSEELVLVSGCHPIQAKKARYYEDRRLNSRVLPPPSLTTANEGTPCGRLDRGAGDWGDLQIPTPPADAEGTVAGSLSDDDPENGGIRREPALPEHEAIASEEPKPNIEFSLLDDETDDDAIRAKALGQRFGAVARQAALDPDDGIPL